MSKKGTFGSNSRNDPLERSRRQNPDLSSPSYEPESEQLEYVDTGAINSKQNQTQPKTNITINKFADTVKAA
jgi:hypothetical protein